MLTTRRTFLEILGVAAAVPSLAHSAPGSPRARGALTGLACNVESWWTDIDFMERFERAAAAGFESIEFWQYDLPGRNVEDIAAHCSNLGLSIVQFTGWGAPSLADPANHAGFERGIEAAIDIADVLDAPMFTIVGHQVVDGIDHQTSLRNIEQALAGVAPRLEASGKTAILEPFNPVDHPGHVLNGSADALRICRAIDSPAVKLNWDLYHMQLTEGNLIASLKAGLDQVGYLQIADVPGRHQPGTGEINYARVFEALDAMGYGGPIGLECWPDQGDEARALRDLVAVTGQGRNE